MGEPIGAKAVHGAEAGRALAYVLLRWPTSVAAVQSCANYLPALELMEQLAMAANALPEGQHG